MGVVVRLHIVASMFMCIVSPPESSKAKRQLKRAYVSHTCWPRVTTTIGCFHLADVGKILDTIMRKEEHDTRRGIWGPFCDFGVEPVVCE